MHLYVVRSKRIDSTTSIKIYLHRELMGALKNQIIDHKDRNPLNNQKSNLRFCTQAQNLANKRRLGKFKRIFKGVHQVRNRWYASISPNGKVIFLGGFSSAIEAGKAYDNAALKYFGDFASLNFP